MARLYSNENFPRPVVEELRRLGHDVLTSHEAGRSRQAIPDPEVLAFARADARAVLTLNRKHFIRLHFQDSDHAGVIVCTYDPAFVGQAGRIHATIMAEGQLDGRLIRINRPG